MITQFAAYALGTVSLYGVFKLVELVYDELTSPLRDIPGPKNDSLIYGNMRVIREAEHSKLQERWVEEYGRTVSYRGFFSMRRLYTMDTKAINHMLVHTEVWQKPIPSRRMLTRLLGPGLLVAEDSAHRKQRKVMNPAFGRAQVRDLTPIYVMKSLELRDKWTEALADADTQAPGNTDATVNVDVLSWLSRMTLDVIGLAGFNYTFDTLRNSPQTNPSTREGKDFPVTPTSQNELSAAFSTLLQTNRSIKLIEVLQMFIPVLNYIPTKRGREVAHARDTMNRIGETLLKDSKAALSQEAVSSKGSGPRDLLSLLVRANTAVDIPESGKLSDEDVLAQVPTFLAAGHETTSTAVTWALYALTQSPETQTKLRAELMTVSTDEPTMDELNNLKYLDCVVREVMRVHAPVPATMRVAVKDDVIPLVEGFVGRSGKTYHEVRVKAGQTVLIPILALNRDRTIWGEDAKSFKPERWENIPEATAAIPGVWGNMLTFLGGPRACIGIQFSLVEVKTLLFTLVRAFEFELAVPVEDIGTKTGVVQRPLVLSEPEKGNQLPLIIKAYKEQLY